MTVVAAAEYVGDKCSAQQIEDPGYYIEAGAYTSYWDTYSWYGDGVSVLGDLAQIYGTAQFMPLVPHEEVIEYDNLNDARGYYHGVEMANERRTTAHAQAEANLPQFRPITNGLGDSYLTIEILCRAWGDSFAASAQSTEDTALTPIDPESGLCLRAIIGSIGGGQVQGPGYGPINIFNEGAETSRGYVEINGQRTDAPAAVQLNGDGANVEGN